VAVAVAAAAAAAGMVVQVFLIDGYMQQIS
jgi:hypothetical protein